MFGEGVNLKKNWDGTLPVILESNINQYFRTVRDRNRCANMPDWMQEELHIPSSRARVSYEMLKHIVT